MDKQKEKLKQMLITEREKVKGYEQIAQINSAYISILLKKLGATEDNPIIITPKDVKEATTSLEARAMINEEGGYGLYVEDSIRKGQCDGVQAEVTMVEREEGN